MNVCVCVYVSVFHGFADFPHLSTPWPTGTSEIMRAQTVSSEFPLHTFSYLSKKLLCCLCEGECNFEIIFAIPCYK